MGALLKILQGVGSKVAAGVSGPLGWLASLLIDRVIMFSWTKLNEWITKLKKNSELKKETKKDEVRGDAYNETLKDGKTEKEQVDASLDVLNGTDRNKHP